MLVRSVINAPAFRIFKNHTRKYAASTERIIANTRYASIRGDHAGFTAQAKRFTFGFYQAISYAVIRGVVVFPELALPDNDIIIIITSTN